MYIGYVTSLEYPLPTIEDWDRVTIQEWLESWRMTGKGFYSACIDTLIDLEMRFDEKHYGEIKVLKLF